MSKVIAYLFILAIIILVSIAFALALGALVPYIMIATVIGLIAWLLIKQFRK